MSDISARISRDDLVTFVTKLVASLVAGTVAAASLDEGTALWGSADGLNLDSLDVLDLLFDLEEQLGVTLPDDLDVETTGTIGDLVELFEKLGATAPSAT